jgi:hypothetical protein
MYQNKYSFKQQGLKRRTMGRSKRSIISREFAAAAAVVTAAAAHHNTIGNLLTTRLFYVLRRHGHHVRSVSTLAKFL